MTPSWEKKDPKKKKKKHIEMSFIQLNKKKKKSLGSGLNHTRDFLSAKSRITLKGLRSFLTL